MTTHTQTVIDSISDLPAETNRRSQQAEVQIGRALDRHRESLLPRLINPAEGRVVREHMAAEMALGFEHRRAMLNLAMESRLQSMREAVNHVLVTGKTHLRQERIDYFGQVYQQLEARMQQLAEDYIASADARYARIDDIRSKHLRERERQRQEKSAGDFLDTLDQLMDEFRSIIGESIDSQGRPRGLGEA